jgi:AGCS family alanine or glycine:cation symporter
MDGLSSALTRLDSLVWSWSPASFLPPLLVVFLLGTGLYLTIGLRLLSFYRLPAAIGMLFGRTGTGNAADGDISPRASLLTALAATVGTGNIAGVATAMTIGGPGALFWMWMTALIGMATKYAEAALALKYREVDARGQHVGGPMYYIKNGMGPRWRWLAWLFALFTAIAGFGIGNMAQSNSVATVVNSALGVPLWISGIIIAVLVFVVIIGGVKSIARWAEILVPAMALIYVGGALLCIALNIGAVPAAFGLIFEGAFSGTAAVGGFAGAAVVAAISAGCSRGMFSNEAGLGSAAIAHASAQTRNPHRLGVIAMLGTFIDTIVICTMTGLVILTAPAVFSADGVSGLPAWQGDFSAPAALTSAAFGAAMPGGEWIVALGLVLFTFTTLLGWSLYGERAIEYLAGVRAVTPYRLLWCFMAFVGAVWANEAVWAFSSVANGLMAAPNLLALLALSGVVFSIAKAHSGRPGDSGAHNLSEDTPTPAPSARDTAPSV